MMILGLDDENWQSKIMIHGIYSQKWLWNAILKSCQTMPNRSKGSLCPILQIHKWYLIIFYNTYIHPFFSSQILQIPNFPDTKQATTAANEWQVCSRSRPCTQQPKGCNDQKVSQKTACQWKKKPLTQFHLRRFYFSNFFPAEETDETLCQPMSTSNVWGTCSWTFQDRPSVTIGKNLWMVARSEPAHKYKLDWRESVISTPDSTKVKSTNGCCDKKIVNISAPTSLLSDKQYSFSNLVVSIPFWKICSSKWESSPSFGLKIKQICWNHQPSSSQTPSQHIFTPPNAGPTPGGLHLLECPRIASTSLGHVDKLSTN